VSKSESAFTELKFGSLKYSKVGTLPQIVHDLDEEKGLKL